MNNYFNLRQFLKHNTLLEADPGPATDFIPSPVHCFHYLFTLDPKNFKNVDEGSTYGELTDTRYHEGYNEVHDFIKSHWGPITSQFDNEYGLGITQNELEKLFRAYQSNNSIDPAQNFIQTLKVDPGDASKIDLSNSDNIKYPPTERGFQEFMDTIHLNRFDTNYTTSGEEADYSSIYQDNRKFADEQDAMDSIEYDDKDVTSTTDAPTGDDAADTAADTIKSAISDLIDLI